jgi:hypothetical protein
MYLFPKILAIFAVISTAQSLPQPRASRFAQRQNVLYRSPRTSLAGIIAQRWANEEGDRPKGAQDVNKEVDDAESGDGFENKPEWLELFPPRKPGSKPEIERDYPDFANMAPDDPLFLDMPWPKEAGPEASAFGRHMQWRRSLTDGERKS